MFITRGRFSKHGPIQSRTNSRRTQDTTDASWVIPPTVCWIMDLEREAVMGIALSHEPTVLLKTFGWKIFQNCLDVYFVA
mgnify:CR=1 FL=1